MIQVLVTLILIFAPIARGAVRIWAYGPIYILTLSMLAIWIFKMFREKEIRFRRTPIDVPILLFGLISFISIFNSKYIYGSIMEVIKFIILALIFYIVVNFIREEREIKRILNVVLMIGTGIALFGILQYLGVITKSWWDKPWLLSATYVNHNHFAGLAELIMPLSIGMILSEKDTSKRSLYIYSFLILSIGFLLSMSRGAWFSLSLSMLFMIMIIFKRGKTRFIISMSIPLLIIFAIFLFNVIDIDFLLKRIAGYWELDLSGRIEIWKGTVGIIKDNWLLGTGPGTFIYNFPKYRPLGITSLINYAHNDYLQIASEMGILAFALAIFIMARIVKKGLRTHNIAKSSFKKWISLSLSVGILGLLLHGLIDFNFYIPANIILFTVFSALIFNISSRKEREYPEVVIRLESALCRIFKPFTLITISTLLFFISTGLAAEIYSTASDKAIFRTDLKRAERLALAAMKICPFNYKYPYKLAGIYVRTSNSELDRLMYIKKSIMEYKKALDLNPIDAWSWIGLADAHRDLSQDLIYNCESARSAYKKALDLDPLNSYYLKKYAEFLLNSGDVNLANQMYKKASIVLSNSKALSQLPMRFIDGEYYENIADLAFAAQDINKAMTHYKMAEVIREDNESAKLGQLRCYLKMSLIKDALLKYRESRFSVGVKSVLFASLGECYLRRGYIDTARRFLEKSLAMDLKNAEAYQLRYKISKKTGKPGYLHKEIYKILNFNHIPVSVDFRVSGFNLSFDIKKDICEKGEFGIDMFLPAGIYEFKVKARGEHALNIWPRMIINFNNEHVMDLCVNYNWEEYSGIITVDSSANRFGILFDNDYYDAESGKDRNLYIDGIKLKAL